MKITKRQLALSIVGVIVLLAGCKPEADVTKVPVRQEMSLYDRVTSTGKIRAAYTIYPPGCFKDENGNLKGVFIETLEQAAKNLNLSIEWTEEVGWETQIEGLKNNRYDMIGSSVWANPKRARFSTLSVPLYYSPLYIYARKGDLRFSENTAVEALNSSDIRISTVDGATGETIAKVQFPKARRIALPQMTDFGVSFMDIVHNKADIVIMEPFQAMKFLETNPGTIVNITPKTPLRVFGNNYMFKSGEAEFQNMLNVTLTDLLSSGFVETLLAKYEKYPNSQLRVALPYRQE